MEAFAPIAILLVVALTLCLGIFGITNILGPKNPIPAKLSPYECGVKPEGSARTPFKTRFYLIAVLFLLFDVEGAFFFPWALVYRESLAQSATLLLALAVYMGLLVLGLIYIFRKDALQID